MKAKPKICKRCQKEKRIFSQGLCSMCDRVANPEKYMIKRAEAKAKSKKPSITKLKKELDDIFSKYIRNKYAVDGMVECYTCGTVKPIKEMQNGHFFSRSHLSVRWNEDNCRPQDSACNIFKHGNYIVYTRKMLSELGEQKFKELEDLKNTTFKPTAEWLQNQIEYYKNKLK
jgi:hypothetical protein